MAVAIRTITRLQDADDAPTLGAGQDGYVLTWDNASGAFVAEAMSAGVTDHGALTGLGDDDHTQYLLATGARTGASSQAQTFTNGIVGPTWKPASDSTTALQLQNAAGTAVLTVDTTNKRLVLPNGVIYGGATPTPMLRVDATTGNIFAGYSANATVTGGNNIALGDGALASLSSGVNNFAAGYYALSAVTTTSNNFALGLIALGNSTGYSNVGVGNYAGRYVGWGCVAIGHQAGNAETGDQRLYIDNQDRGNEATGRISSLIYGEFNATVGSQLLRANGVFQALMTDAATNAVTTQVRISHNTSGTAAAGFGGAVLFELQSSTTAAQSAAGIKALWNDATHGSRKADLVLTAFDTSEREGLRIRGAGSAPAIGFYGVTPIVRATLATGAGASVDDVITALQNLGLVKQS